MVKGKINKNNPEVRSQAGTQKVNLVLSNDCEKCNDKCNAGIRYIDRIQSGKAGIGIVCKK